MGTPWWARPALLAIVAAAGVLFAWHLPDSGYSPFYSAAARSMSESWAAFLYGSLDPNGSITIDKIPGFLWPDALSARIFGFQPWSQALPQVVEGIVTVLVLFRIVRRWAGPAAGLLAAAILTLTPVIASLFGHIVEDAALTMCLVLAADALLVAVDTGRLRWLLLAGLWVGVAFQTKMLMAWMVLPALGVTYLAAAPATTRRRLAHLGLAGAVVVLVSASWMLVVALTPADHRPYVDATSNNSVFAMVVGYNALARFGGLHLSGALVPNFGPLAPEATSPFKLLSPTMATQVGWLYPLAVVALVFGLASRRGAPRTDRTRTGFLLWTLWLGVSALAFAAGVVLHTAYTAALAVPIAALAGAGLVQLAAAFRRGGAWTWVLPATLVATVAWTISLSSRYAGFLPWLGPLAIGLAALALVGMAVAVVTRRSDGRIAVAAVSTAVLAMVVTPAAWAGSVLDTRYDGTVIDASAGPLTGAGLQSPVVAAAIRQVLASYGGSATAFGAGPLTPQQARLVAYLRADRQGTDYLFAAQDEALAALVIIKSGEAVLTMGGFSGTAPHPTLGRFQAMVRAGQVRYVLLGVNLPRAPGAPETAASQIATWVRATCTLVPAAEYGGAPPGPANPAAPTLYRCAR